MQRRPSSLRGDPQRGQSLVEYALTLVLVAVVMVTVLAALGRQITTVFTHVASALGGG